MTHSLEFETGIHYVSKVIRSLGFAIDEAIRHGNNVFIRIVKPERDDESLGVISIPLSAFSGPELSARRGLKEIVENTCKSSLTYLETGIHG